MSVDYKEFKDRYTISDIWNILKLPFSPGKSCYSPFRDETRPSFSVYDNGYKFKDHGTGEGGDVIEFIKLAFNGNKDLIKQFINNELSSPSDYMLMAPKCLVESISEPKVMQIPGTHLTPSESILEQFSISRNISIDLSEKLVIDGNIEFRLIGNEICYLVTDSKRINGEIRKLDKSLFFSGTKAYPMKGIDKSWLLGGDNIQHDFILLCEGATDFISAKALIHENNLPISPLALLGAACRNLNDELIDSIKGKHVRIAGDGDRAGLKMINNWTQILNQLDCTVDSMDLPEGSDLTDYRNNLKLA